MLLHSGPLGVMIQYLPFSFTTSTPLMVAFSRPFPDGTNERSATHHGRPFVTHPSSSRPCVSGSRGGVAGSLGGLSSRPSCVSGSRGGAAGSLAALSSPRPCLSGSPDGAAGSGAACLPVVLGSPAAVRASSLLFGERRNVASSRCAISERF